VLGAGGWLAFNIIESKPERTQLAARVCGQKSSQSSGIFFFFFFFLFYSCSLTSTIEVLKEEKEKNRFPIRVLGSTRWHSTKKKSLKWELTVLARLKTVTTATSLNYSFGSTNFLLMFLCCWLQHTAAAACSFIDAMDDDIKISLAVDL
jgi:hypothetical protein